MSGRSPRRSALGASLGLLLVAAAGAPGCNSVLGLGDLQIGVKCGVGTELVDGQCQPIATADPEAPSFGGVISLSPVTPTSLLVHWDAAASATVPPAEIVYSVYLATKKGGEDFHAPAAVVTGVLSATLDGLTPGADAYVVVRAAGPAGHQDGNLVELHQKAQADTTAPDFAGVETATPAPGGMVALGWSPATDDLSGAAALTYLVFAGEQDPVTSAPPVATVTGVTSTLVVVPKPQAPYHFVVRAEDAAGNQDQNTQVRISTAGADLDPPAFGGCVTAAGTASNQITVSWAAGHDAVTPDADLGYEVYAFTSPGPHADLATAASHAAVQGQTSVVVGNLLADTPYYLECLAHDLSGNVGGNPKDTLATTLKDTAPPTFGGALTGAPVSPDSYEVTVTWAPGADVQTPPEKLAYDVFTSSTAGGEDYLASPAATVTGTTQASLLLSPGATTYLVVLARDEAGNASTAIHEIAVTPHISYDCQVQPIFEHSCVSGCHDLNQKQYNPILARPVSYTFISNDGVIVPFHPELSWLYQDLTCIPASCPPGAPECLECGVQLSSGNIPHHMPQPKMPPNPDPLPEEIELIKNWLLEGAAGPLLPSPGTPPGYSASPNCHP
jgi:hypothetical protein